MAFSRDQKKKIVAQYNEWLSRSSAIFMIEYSKLNMKEIDSIRAKAREAGGEAHVVKNTLMDIALEQAKFTTKGELTGTTLMAFAFNDAPALAKVFSDLVKNDKTESYKLKGGFLDKHTISATDVKSLADLPPLPVMRAKLLGTIMAPASQLVRTINEPARSVAAVIKAYSEQAAPTAG